MIEILNTVGSLLYADKLKLKPGDMVGLDADLEESLIKRGLAEKITPGPEIPDEDPEDAPESDQEEEKTDEPEEDPEDAPVIEAEAPVSKTNKKTSSRKKGTK